ncbi:MAG: sle, partial [Frankiales bacterium]|nr:sle [Frankiales bacterium]
MASTAPPRARKSAPKKAPARKPAARKPPARKPAARNSHGPGLVAKTGHAVTALLTGLAHLVGGLTRATTGGAKNLDPAHRRDGAGLLLLAAALVAAGGAWWHAGGAGAKVD